MSFFVAENISKSYISTKHGALGFNVLYKSSFFKDKINNIETIIDFKIDVIIEWICHVNGSFVEKLSHSDTVLYFSQHRDGTFSVDDFILPFKDYGVGSIVFKEVLLIAKKHIPDANVHLSLSHQDEKEEKGEDWENRRNHFYEKFGLKMSDNKRSYSALLQNIVTDVKLENVKEVDLYELLSSINKCNIERTNLQECCKTKEKLIEICYNKRDKSFKISMYLGVVLLFFIVLFARSLT